MAHTFTGRGFKIHYVEEGSGRALVLAHGLAMDHTMFAAQFEELPDRNRCIAWDMRGHGQTECPPGPWALQDVVVDLIRFIEGLNAAPCHLAGMSIGGMAALRIAIQRPDLLRSLVLIDTSADAEDPERVPQYEAYAQVIASEGVTDELARTTAPLLFGPAFIAEQEHAVAIHVERVKKMPRQAFVEGIRALNTRDSVLDRLPQVRVPTLVLHGTEDAAIPIAQGEAIAGGIPGARLVRIEGAGHTSPMEAPDAVSEAMSAFFADHP